MWIVFSFDFQHDMEMEEESEKEEEGLSGCLFYYDYDNLLEDKFF